jgi:aspartate ammonia-lyase
LSQSTNDVYPTALRLTLSMKLDGLLVEMLALQQALADKGIEFLDVIKMGRTQLQDAVPMTLGQEFDAWSVTVGEDIARVGEAQSLIHEINLGATAIGTGLNAPAQYAEKVTARLGELSGVPVVQSQNLVEATQDAGAYVQLSGVLKRVAVKLSKLSNDLRLLSSGPRAGLGEINLPPMAPGSSIMPGKVNPIIPEVVNQVAFEVIGNDLTVTMAAEAGQLELNAMEPVIAYNLFTSLDMLGRACRTLVKRCIVGITANREHCRQQVENSIGLVTALNPLLGYEKATEIAEEALRTGKSVVDVVLEKGYLSLEQIEKILSPHRMIR